MIAHITERLLSLPTARHRSSVLEPLCPRRRCREISVGWGKKREFFAIFAGAKLRRGEMEKKEKIMFQTKDLITI